MLNKFIQIFDGMRNARGVTKLTGKQRERDGKRETENKIWRQEVTEQHFQDHLNGNEPALGIVPNRDDNLCKWGVVDVDVYKNFKHDKIVALLKNTNAIVFRSKSGGAHVFLFTNEWVTAKLMRSKLKMMAAFIGYADAEIIPQQDEKTTEKSIGKYLNLPYHGNGNTNRYAFDEECNPLSLEEFYKLHDKKVLTKKQLEDFKLKFAAEDTKEDDPFYGMPPCLKILLTQKVSEGTRDNTMTQLCVYLKKRHGKDFIDQPYKYNDDYFDPPLSKQEVQKTIDSVAGKDYQYMCKVQPMQSVCQALECATQKFGIDDGDMPTALPESIEKYDSDPPIYVVNIENGQVECYSDELWHPDKFGVQAMEQAGVIMGHVTKPLWLKHLNKLFSKGVPVVETPESSKMDVQIKEMFEKFVSRAPAEQIDDVHLGKPFTKEDGYTVFKWIDFWDYLRDNGWEYKRMTKNKTQKFFIDLYGAEEKQPKIGIDNTTTRVLELKTEEIYKPIVRKKENEKAPFE